MQWLNNSIQIAISASYQTPANEDWKIISTRSSHVWSYSPIFRDIMRGYKFGWGKYQFHNLANSIKKGGYSSRLLKYVIFYFALILV